MSKFKFNGLNKSKTINICEAIFNGIKVKINGKEMARKDYNVMSMNGDIVETEDIDLIKELAESGLYTEIKESTRPAKKVKEGE